MKKTTARKKSITYPEHGGEPMQVTEPAVSARPVPVQKTWSMGAQYELTAKDFADVLEVTPKTLSRWRQSREFLSPQQSDRVAVLESILALGERVLGTPKRVKDWIHNPVLYLDGGRPLEFLKTESGRRKVEEALHQIEFGMY